MPSVVLPRLLPHRSVLALLVALLCIGAAACGGDHQSNQAQSAATFGVTTATGTASPTAAANAVATPTEPEFPAPPADAQIARLLIPVAKVDAPTQIKGLNAQNEMENPDGKDNVAWYNFTGRPGFGSNAVFSGHVDWFTGERGVFWFLRDLKDGDEVDVKLSDGTILKYHVTSNETYNSADAPVAEIIGPTSRDTVTLITCDGTFSRNTQEYDKRRVVRAVRFA